MNHEVLMINEMLSLPVVEINNEIDVSYLSSLNISDLKAMGSTMLPTIESVRSLAGDDKMYRVTMPVKGNLMKLKDGSGYTSSIVSAQKKAL